MPKTKNRGNGQGSVYKRGAVWCAEIRQSRPAFRKRKSGFATKTDALKWVASIDINAELSRAKVRGRENMLFSEVYEEWLPTHARSKQTLDCYRAAYAYFAEVHDLLFRQIEIEDLQACVDDCPKGRRTKENMRALASLLYKYAIPRRISRDGLNLASYIRIYETSASDRVGLPLDILPRLQAAVGNIPFADYVFALCLTGFRVSAFLDLRVEDYDPARSAVTGGIKTAAGRRRIVTLAPAIKPIFDAEAAGRKQGLLFQSSDGGAISYTYFRDVCFYPVLERLGIANPIQNGRHLYTPHSCRHTFANLLKNAPGADKDKLELMGHTSTEMLQYYQSADYDSLKAITDQIYCGQ